jgi:WD40 repeat protein
VAAACDDGSAYVYETSDVSALSAPLVLTGHVGPVRACAFTSDGHRLVTGGDDGIVRIRDAVTGATVRDWTGHASTIWSIATTPAHDLIATAGEDNVLRLWRPDVADEPVTAMRVDGPLRCSHWDEDGQTLTAGGSAGLYRFSLRGARFSEVR